MDTLAAPKPLVSAAADTPKRRIRAGGHLRISSDPKDKREGVDRQREDVTVLGQVKDWDIVEWFVDNDTSASKGKERKEWNRLLAKIEAGELDAIAAWDQDRNWRMMTDLEDLRKFFKSLDRQILLATTGQGDIDLYSPTGVMMAQIKTAVSEHEIAMMKVRQCRAGRQRAERGIPKWRKAFGYLPETRPKQDDDGIRQLDPATAPLVADAYRTVLAGGSISDIARAWNKAGVFGLTGQPWSPSTVSLFLRAPRNAGLRAHNDEIVGKGTWPGLVDESTWRAAQAVLNAPGRAPGRKSVRRHLLTGVLQCGKKGCGGHLRGHWTLQKKMTYACKQCRGVSVRAEYVEVPLILAVGGRLARPDAVDLLKAEQHDLAEAEAIRAQLSTLYGELEQIGVERGQRLLTGAQAKIATDIIEEEIAACLRRQQDQERLRVFEGIPLGTPEAVDAVLALSPDRFRAVLSVVATVTVKPVGKGGKVFDPKRVDVDFTKADLR